MRFSSRLCGSTLKSPISTTGLPLRTHGVTVRATLRICARRFACPSAEMCVLQTRVALRRTARLHAQQLAHLGSVRPRQPPHPLPGDPSARERGVAEQAFPVTVRVAVAAASLGHDEPPAHPPRRPAQPPPRRTELRLAHLVQAHRVRPEGRGSSPGSRLNHRAHQTVAALVAARVEVKEAGTGVRRGRTGKAGDDGDQRHQADRRTLRTAAVQARPPGNGAGPGVPPHGFHLPPLDTAKHAALHLICDD